MTRSTGEVFSKHRSRAVIVSLGAAFGLILVLVLVSEALTPGRSDRQSGHNSWSYGTRGFRALYEALEKLGYRVERFRRTYHGLPPAEGSVLLSLDPGNLQAAIQARMNAQTEDPTSLLRSWVESGGCLIITRPSRRLLSYGGFEISVGSDADNGDSGATGGAPEDGTLFPAPSGIPHPLWEDLPRVKAQPFQGTMRTRSPLESFSAEFPALSPGQARALGVYLVGENADSIELFDSAPASALVAVGDGALALHYEVGEGDIICFSSALPFANAALKWTPATEVVTTVLHHFSDGGRRQIYFDEFTHGFYRKSGLLRWARETALFYPLATALMGLFLAGWYGAVRFGPPRPERETPRRAKEEFVLSLGDMYRRGGHYGHALALIVEGYEAHLAKLLGTTADSFTREIGPEPQATRFTYGVPTSEQEFFKESRRLHEQYLIAVNIVRGKKTLPYE